MTQQKVILITGTSRGLGRDLARHYAGTGARVIGCSRSGSDFRHENYTNKVIDISDEQGVAAMFLDIRKEHKRLDILINNAGVKMDSLVALSSVRDLQEMIGANFLGAIWMTREAVKLMKRHKFGRVINISSIAVPLGSIGAGVYAATKAAVEQFSYSLARECAADDITLNTVGVSVFSDSGMVDAISAKQLKRAQENLIKPELLETTEIIHAIDFFCAREAEKITNQIVYFGGVR